MNKSGAAVSAVTALALAIAEGMDTDDLALLGALFTQLGDTITSIAMVRDMEQKDQKQDKKLDTDAKK